MGGSVAHAGPGRDQGVRGNSRPTLAGHRRNHGTHARASRDRGGPGRVRAPGTHAPSEGQVMLYGCDVSSYQAGLNLGGLVKEGYSFCWIRASIGNTIDPEFYDFLWQAQSAGMLAAGYHFLLPSSTVSLEAQASLFSYRLRGTPGIVDVEPNGDSAPVPSMPDLLGVLGWWSAYHAD